MRSRRAIDTCALTSRSSASDVGGNHVAAETTSVVANADAADAEAADAGAGVPSSGR